MTGDTAGSVPVRRRSWWSIVVLTVLMALGVIVATLVVLALIPLRVGDLGAQPRPTATYDEAVAAFDAYGADESGLGVVDDCHSRLFTGGERTQNVIVLFHGLTNCPQQMVKLAEQLEQQGANVVVLRAPGHGQASGPGGLAGIEAEQFRDFADRSIDIATGLGDHVTVMGLSLGGLISTWTVIERPEVQRAVIIAPAYQLGGYSEPVQYAVGNLFARMPNVAIPSSGEGLGDHAYPETPTRGVGQMLRLGRYVMGQAAARPPIGKQIAFVINDADTTISNAAAEQVIDEWRADGVDVTVVHLPKSLGLPHDLIDPAQAVQDPALVYPLIEALAEGRTPPPVPNG
jgi:pimeloyl-ACP methyl ester carboxylesterase